MGKISIIKFLAVLFLLLSFTSSAHAKASEVHLEHHQNHRAKTIGQQKFHLFLTYSLEYEEVKTPHTITRTQEADIYMEYGLLDWLDIIVDVPLNYRTVNGEKTYSGPDDIEISSKIRFFKKDGFSMAVAPFIDLPNWGYKYGIGEGRIQSGVTLYATQNVDPFSVTFSGTYKRNENIVNDRLDIYKFYILPSYKITNNLSLTTSVGLERDTDKKNEHNPIYVSGGFVYKVNDLLSIVPSVKVAFQKPERDITVLLGTHWTF